MKKDISGLNATGSIINDKVQNIYDLEGNIYEWTLEGHSNYQRVFRGANFSTDTHSAVTHQYMTSVYPRSVSYAAGTRITLYIR